MFLQAPVCGGRVSMRAQWMSFSAAQSGEKRRGGADKLAKSALGRQVGLGGAHACPES